MSLLCRESVQQAKSTKVATMKRSRNPFMVLNSPSFMGDLLLSHRRGFLYKTIFCRFINFNF